MPRKVLAIAFVCTAAAWAAIVLPAAAQPELKGLWRFEEGTGSSVADESDQSVAGTIVNAQWVTNDPDRGIVLSFDGDGDYVEILDFVTEMAVGDFSIAAWVKIPNGLAGALLLKGDGNRFWNPGEKQLWFGDGGFCCNFDGERPGFVGFGNAYLIPDTDISTAGWHHLVVTWDHTGGISGSGQWYIDGVAQVLLTSLPYVAQNADRASDWIRLGWDGSEEAGHDFDGLLDDVAIYQGVLTSGEIEDVMIGEFWLFADGFESGDTSAWSSSSP